MILIKIVALQAFWFFVVLYGHTIMPLWQLALAAGLLVLDYLVFKPKVSLGRYLFLITIFLLAGVINDYGLIGIGMIEGESYQLGNLSLWIVFLAYYEEIFVKFKNLSLPLVALIAGVAGAMTYWSAAKLGGIVIIQEKHIEFLLSQFVFWGVFFPLSLRLYFNNKYWSRFLDKTIVFSFDQTGFVRHQKEFDEDLTKIDLKGKSVLVTGATGGIGSDAAASFSRLGARVFITGRNLQKGQSFEAQNPHSTFVSLDMADWKKISDFAKGSEVFDLVVFNAGGMPESLLVNEQGVEFQCASQLCGHYYLLQALRENGKLRKGARVVWVSSGGMYLKKLDLNNLFQNSHYDKVDAYANVKRAQVTLVEELAKKDEWKDYYLYSMHPGWVGTEGLKEALPKFYQLMKNRLRTSGEGADTILWCLLSSKPAPSGGFYFDRKKASPYVGASFIPSTEQRLALLRELERLRSS